MNRKYISFFDIDPNYFPEVNSDLIENGQVKWQDFYPHKTFVTLLETTIKVLERREKHSIWVEGAYGTGKSHAIFALRKLLDSSEEETSNYFHRYQGTTLSTDLFNKLMCEKKQGIILTPHRSGSSQIVNDNTLIFALQESILEELESKNLSYHGNGSLKNVVLKWLTSEQANRDFLNAKIQDKYSAKFNGDTVNDIIQKLTNLDSESALPLMDRLHDVFVAEGITGLIMDAQGFKDWVTDIIEHNKLKAIVFIWDEFTEYFKKNTNSLSGFQNILELTNTEPFYMVIVTHSSTALFHETYSDKNKIFDRFVNPTCRIELPENMAFKLIGHALKKKTDTLLEKEWNQAEADLNGSLKSSRTTACKLDNISEEDVKNILPIHPFTALILKRLSSAFGSNQRSMFDFIKSSESNDDKSFQWFISEYGPYDSWPFLTIDMLWDYFYVKGRDLLSGDIREVLSSYYLLDYRSLSKEQERVLKTVLLMQSISQSVGNSVELLIPNDANINLAYDGTDLEGKANTIAANLVDQKRLYRKPLSQGKTMYSSMVNGTDEGEVEKKKKNIASSSVTSKLILDFPTYFSLSPALGNHFSLRAVAIDNFKIESKKAVAQSVDGSTVVLVAFARNDEEASELSKEVADLYSGNPEANCLILDATSTCFGTQAYDEYLTDLANSAYQEGKDNDLAGSYKNMATSAVKTWLQQVREGRFVFYSRLEPNGESMATYDACCDKLFDIDQRQFPYGLSLYVRKVTDYMFGPKSIPLGVECGIEKKTSGAFKSSNPQTSLERTLKAALLNDDFLTSNPNDPVSKAKLAVEEKIQKAFKSSGRISIREIVDTLHEPPFGYFACNLAAVIIGCILRDYAQSTYRWSDGTYSIEMSKDKLKEMVSDALKLYDIPDGRYKDKFIVKMTPDEKGFASLSSTVFKIDESYCSSIEQTRNYVCLKTKDLQFPLWVLKNIIDDHLITPKNILDDIIDDYCKLSSTQDPSGMNDLALKIGKLSLQYPDAKNDLSRLVTKEKCRDGIVGFVDSFMGGELSSLANKIGDGGKYVEAIHKKFDADASTWVWDQKTGENKICEVLVEYRIIALSNGINDKTDSFSDAITAWNEKCKRFKISHEVLVEWRPQIDSLVEFLLSVCRGTVSFSPENENEFFDLIQRQGALFKEAYQNQFDCYQNAFKNELACLLPEEVKTSFDALSVGDCFTDDKASYQTRVRQYLENFVKQLQRNRLLSLWREKTNSQNPADWSQRNKTPILCLASDDEYAEAKFVFGTINGQSNGDDAIEKAINFVNSSPIIERMKDPAQIDQGFRRRILKDYSAIINDLSSIRAFLSTYAKADCYEWVEDPGAQALVRKFADDLYRSGGFSQALSVIENMDQERLKKYLESLVKDNVVVGLEIIKSEKEK